MIKLTSDMKDLIVLFNEHNVDYLICGGYAVGYYGYIRATFDFDILINPNKKNAIKTMKALTKFGFGNAGFDESYFTKEGTAIHMGVEPNAIDLLTSVSSEKTSSYFKNTVTDTIDGIELRIIGFDDLIKVKKLVNRNKDRIDVEELLAKKNKEKD